MDIISGMLSTLRLDASIFLHSTFCKEWVIDLSSMDTGTFHLISHGSCWLHLPHIEPVPLNPRDLIFLPHNAPHLITSSPDKPDDGVPRNTPADVVSGPSATLICGSLTFNQNFWNPLIDALPEYVILPTSNSRDTTLGNVIEALISECEQNEAGGEAIIDRLADIVLIEVLRAYLRKGGNSSYLHAVADPKISAALEEFHTSPGNNWNVENLAASACMSRSAFAERFQNLVGMAPMHYATRWRMQLAHQKLTESTETIDEIAACCGYQSSESLSKAFRKEFGQGPNAVRHRETYNEPPTPVTIEGNPLSSSKILYSPLEVNQLRTEGSVVIVDIRDNKDYQRGHIPGAVNLPELFHTLSLTTAEGLQEMQQTLTPLLRKVGVCRDKAVIFYEDSLESRCGGSCRAYFQLAIFDHSRAGVLDGGLDLWIKEGYPVNCEDVHPAPSIFALSLQRDALATVDDILASFDHPEIKLLDNRDKDEWLGITSSPNGYYSDDFLPRKGRIPGSRWVEWSQFMETVDGITHFKSGDNIIALCAQAGLYLDDDIIIYCFKGARAANTYIALKLAGFKHVRNYYGSWNEWARNASLPVMSVQLMG